MCAHTCLHNPPITPCAFAECVLSVCGTLCKGNALLKRKKSERNKTERRKMWEEKKLWWFLESASSETCKCWLCYERDAHHRHSRRRRFLLAGRAWTSVVKASSYCCTFWAAVSQILKIYTSSQSVCSHQLADRFRSSRRFFLMVLTDHFWRLRWPWLLSRPTGERNIT